MCERERGAEILCVCVNISAMHKSARRCINAPLQRVAHMPQRGNNGFHPREVAKTCRRRGSRQNKSTAYRGVCMTPREGNVRERRCAVCRCVTCVCRRVRVGM